VPIRNIAIIAHVDHGKTTLVDQMLRQAGVFRVGQQVQERIMDSNPLERERGITILSKNTAIHWGRTKINLVDTPGHADFGGEVERILRMVDGVLLLVDAAEGPMPQTRFVTRKALNLGLSPIIVINKVDRPDARPVEVHDEVLELLLELEADERQLYAPFLYASGRQGWASPLPDHRGDDLKPLFEAIIASIPAPRSDPDGPFQMLVSTVDYNPYVGRLAIGRIERGRIRVGETVRVLPLGKPGPVLDEEEGSRDRVQQLYGFRDLERVSIPEASAGDIIALAGMEGIEVGVTLTDPFHPDRLLGIAVEEPTMSVDFMVNNSPLVGQSGRYVTSRQLRERLLRELERNVALRVEDTSSPDTFAVSGRGELHLSILMETMRREGYEFQVGRPRVVERRGPRLERLEPWEELLVEVPEPYMGIVMEGLGPRRSELIDLRHTGRGTLRLRFRIPARGLFGYRSEFLTDTRGEGILYHRFLDYAPWAGALEGRRNGVLVADRGGPAVAYAIFNLQERGTFFVSPGDDVYKGMIVGEHSRPGDLDVNVQREKKLSNMRTHAADEMIRLEPPRPLTLESGLEFIAQDELMEVTPAALRLRKRQLNAEERKRLARQATLAEA
jgi:GTP-binding protein